MRRLTDLLVDSATTTRKGRTRIGAAKTLREALEKDAAIADHGWAVGAAEDAFDADPRLLNHYLKHVKGVGKGGQGDLAHLYNNPIDYVRKALQLRPHDASAPGFKVYQRIDQNGTLRRVVHDLNTDEFLFYRIESGSTEKKIFSMFKPDDPKSYTAQQLIQREGYALVP